MLLNSLYSFMGSLCFGVLFNVKGLNLLVAGIGGGLGWFSYEVFNAIGATGSTYALFIATIIISIYSEIMARVLKQPVTIFVVSAMIPLVPGSGMYYTTFEAVSGNLEASVSFGLKTLYDAGSIAIAIIFVSTLARIVKFKNKTHISNMATNLESDESTPSVVYETGSEKVFATINTEDSADCDINNEDNKNSNTSISSEDNDSEEDDDYDDILLDSESTKKTNKTFSPDEGKKDNIENKKE